MTGRIRTSRIQAALCEPGMSRRTMSTIPSAQTISSGIRMNIQVAVDAAIGVT
jgi:hypothetical protein